MNHCVACQAPRPSARDPRPELGPVVGSGYLGQVRTLTNSPGHITEEVRLDVLQESEKTSIRRILHLATTLSHPNIIPIESIFETSSVIYASMERPPCTLETLIKEAKDSKRKIPSDTVLLAILQIAEAITYLHGFATASGDTIKTSKVTYKALQPSNVFVGCNGCRFLISAIGICIEHEQTDTCFYSAPEILIHNRCSAASVMWSLGVITYELATGIRPNFRRTTDPRLVFVQDWKPDLILVRDKETKKIGRAHV